jgi:Zn-dependent protease with chaperone function
MDFFEAQERARKHTAWLIALFALAVCGTVLALYVAARWFQAYAWHHSTDLTPFWDPLLFANVAGATLAVIASGTLYKTAVVNASAESIPIGLGGRLVDPNTRDPYEKRLLNIVDEMAIASGIAVPAVYVLPQEPGINAFAVGFDPSRAAIAVTDGCLKLLSRDELQGVVAHEFSHLLNGDSRISLRLLGLVHGILVIGLLGSILLRMGNRTRFVSLRRKASLPAAVMLVGLSLYVIGWIGVFFTRLIKAAVSRERELLADASGVQFTRNAAGLASALKKVAGYAPGSLLLAPRAEEASHLYFGEGMRRFISLFETHPPLRDRIRQLDPQFDGEVPAVDLAPVSIEEETAVVTALAPGAAIPIHARGVVSTVGSLGDRHVAYARSLVEAIPQRLRDGIREPWVARAVVLALLLDDKPETRAAQIEALVKLGDPQLPDQVTRASAALRNCPRAARLPIVDLSLPALRRLSPAQFEAFRTAVDRLVHADSRVGLFEYALQRVLMRHLSVHFALESDPAPAATLDVQVAVSILLSMLAYAGSTDPAIAAASFQAARLELGRGRLHPIFLPREKCDVRQLDRALRRLADTAPRLRAEVLAACVAAVASDGKVTIFEGELLRAIADALGCPMPPLLPGQQAEPAPLRRTGSQ